MDSQLTRNRAMRRFLLLALVGTASLLAGLAWDAHLHKADPDLAMSEGLLTWRNPGHLLAAVGVVLVVTGVAGGSWLLWLRDRPPAARMAGTVTLVVAIVAAGGLAVAPSSGADHGRGDDHQVRDYESLWEAASDDERSAAMTLVADSKAATAIYTGYEQALDAGYRPIPRGGDRATHHPNPALMRDGKVLDPGAPESLVYWTAPEGRKVLVGVVYKAAPKEVAPAPGGELTTWHTHAGGQTCHPAIDDDCPDDGVKMLHVFFFEGVQDPFASSMAAAAGGRAAFARATRS